ncbi:response regulator [bacterium]|nr:response regulator [bacterium]
MTLKRLLVVEDEALVATDLSFRLQALGYEVVGIADNAIDAWALCEAQVPDLVLMDIHIKGDRDGIETAHTIRRRWDIPVVYVTAYSDDATVGRATESDPFGYILKPFDERTVQITIEIAFHKYRTQNALKQREQWIRSVIDTLSDWVVVTNRDGVIEFLNTGAQAGLGAAVGESLQSVIRLVDREGHLMMMNPIELVAKSGVPQMMEWVCVERRDAPPVTVSISAAPLLDHHDSQRGVVTCFHNISRRKEVERALWTVQQSVTDQVNHSVKRYQRQVGRYQTQLDRQKQTIKELNKVKRRYIKLTQGTTSLEGGDDDE